MKVDKVFINTYKYDFYFARICIASIRYWYPEIPIYLIKDEKEGSFDSSFTERVWNVRVLDIPRKNSDGVMESLKYYSPIKEKLFS